MPKPPIKIQKDLERHICVYIRVLKDKGYDVDATVLEESIQIMRTHYYAVLPNQCRMKRAVLGALYDADRLLSVDNLMDALSEARLIADRRRVSMRLVECKKNEEVSNPVRGLWRIEKAGRAYVKKDRSR